MTEEAGARAGTDATGLDFTGQVVVITGAAGVGMAAVPVE